MSDSLWPHGPQHTWPPYPSPTFGVYSNSCPLSWWCHPTISSSVIPFSPCPQSFPESGSFQMSQFFASGFTHILFPFWMWNYSTFLDVEHFFKSTEFVSILLLFFFFFGFEGCGILPPLSRAETCTPYNGRWSLNHWTTREVPQLLFSNSTIDINFYSSIETYTTRSKYKQ